MAVQTTLENLEVLLREAAAAAVHGSGCSDVLFERAMHQSMASLLVRAHPGQRDAVERRLVEHHGFRSGGPSLDFEADECATTGIQKECCPCGRHE